MVHLHHLRDAAAYPPPTLRGYRHVAPVPEGQTKHFRDFGDPFLLDFAVKTPARVGLVCENCDDIINASNEIYRAFVS